MPALPSQSTLISLPPDQQFQALDTLFEPSPDLHAIVGPMLSTQAFSSYPSLIDAIGVRLSTLSTASSPADQQVLIKILGSHPRLGRPAPNTSAESLSELSKKEQANLNTSGAEEQTERLRLMNEEYERQFPGLRFVTFVNGRNREMTMEEMRQRIDRNNRNQEIHVIIQAMCDIAKDRANKLQPASRM